MSCPTCPNPYPQINSGIPENYILNNFRFKPPCTGATDSSTFLMVKKANTLFNGMRNGVYPRFPVDYSQFFSIRNAANWATIPVKPNPCSST
tara:strand:+ start:647 stop:922 length:276 start_codon:yes stop_codon:yes gene_type:complete